MICIRITVHSGQVGQIFACHLISWDLGDLGTLFETFLYS